jgi:hypothetical protein
MRAGSHETASGRKWMRMEGGRRMDHRLFQHGQWTLRLRERWSQISQRIMAFVAPVTARARATWTETPRWSQRLALGALGVATLTLIANIVHYQSRPSETRAPFAPRQSSARACIPRRW